jgi:hypothetical protein
MKQMVAVFSVAALLFAPHPSLAASDGLNAYVRQARYDIDPVFSPSLTRLQSTKLRYIGEGSPSTPVMAMTPTTMPGLSAHIRCRGKRACYLEIAVEAQVVGDGGAMGFDLVVNGESLDAAIGSIMELKPETYELAQRRFMIKIEPGRHELQVVVFGTRNFAFVRHAATYRVYVK